MRDGWAALETIHHGQRAAGCDPLLLTEGQHQICAPGWAEEVYYLKGGTVQCGEQGGGISRAPLHVAWHSSARCLVFSVFSLSASD